MHKAGKRDLRCATASEELLAGGFLWELPPGLLALGAPVPGSLQRGCLTIYGSCFRMMRCVDLYLLLYIDTCIFLCIHPSIDVCMFASVSTLVCLRIFLLITRGIGFRPLHKLLGHKEWGTAQLLMIHILWGTTII